MAWDKNTDTTGLNEDQKRMLRLARAADIGAAFQGRYSGAEADFRANLLAQQAARMKIDQQQTEQGGRSFAAGGNVTPAQAVAAMRTGQPYDISMLLQDQAKLIDKPTRIEMGSRYGNLSDLTNLYNATKPNPQIMPDNTVADMNSPDIIGKRYTKVGEGQQIDPATGQVTYAPGYVQGKAQVAGAEANATGSAQARWAGPIANAQESAKAQWDTVEVTGPDGAKYLVPRSAVIGGQTVQGPNGPTQVPFSSGRSPIAEGADQAAIDANKRRWETAQTQAQNAGTIRQNAYLLRDLSRSTGGGSFAPLKAGAANLLVSLGVAGADAEQYASDVKSFSTIAGGQVLANLKQFGANPTEGERNFALSLGQQATDLPKTVEATSAAAISAADKSAAYWQFVQGYQGDPRKIDSAWEQTPYGKYGFFADPEMQSWVKSRGGTVQVNPRTGQLRMQLPNGQKIGDW